MLPSLKKIATVPCSVISPDAREMAAAGLTFPVIAIPQPLKFFGKARLKEEITSQSLDSSSNLTFLTEIPIDTSLPIAFIVTDHLDRTFIIGAFEPPFPVVKQEPDTGDSPSSQAAVSVTVTWSHSPIFALTPEY